jgi:hypothetical protein
MLSPFTPPGTKIVHIRISMEDRKQLNLNKNYSPCKLVIGNVYTVKEIVPFPDSIFKEKFVVILEEQLRECPPGEPPGYSIQAFRRLDLPSCLTELLVSTPAPELVD